MLCTCLDVVLPGFDGSTIFVFLCLHFGFLVSPVERYACCDMVFFYLYHDHSCFNWVGHLLGHGCPLSVLEQPAVTVKLAPNLLACKQTSTLPCHGIAGAHTWHIWHQCEAT